jgi:hypothetical protein
MIRKLRRFESFSNSVVYTAKQADFTSEEDDYRQGAFGSGTSWNIPLRLEASTLKELFHRIKEELYMTDKDYSWAVMTDESCFWVSYLGNADNDLASKSEIDAWKRGKERLWYVQGRIVVQKHSKSLDVPDEEMKELALSEHLELA